MVAEERTVVLVTGGSGLVGEGVKWVIDNVADPRFHRRKNEEWVFLSSKDADLRDFKQVARVFEKHKPTHVLHLAAMVGGLFKNMAQEADMFRDNILINSAVIEMAHQYKVKKLVACLSTCIFPDQTPLPLDETMVHLGPPHDSNYGYAYAKRMVDIQCRTYNEQYGDLFTTVVPTNIFGPNDNFNLRDSHVLPGLMHKCYLAIRDEKQFVISGTGKPLRQFIYSRDLARLMIWAVREYEEIAPILFTVGEKNEISIENAARVIAKHMGYKGEIGFDKTKSDGQYRKPASNMKLMRYLPDFKFTPFEDAIQETVEWFTKNYEAARK